MVFPFKLPCSAFTHKVKSKEFLLLRDLCARAILPPFCVPFAGQVLLNRSFTAVNSAMASCVALPPAFMQLPPLHAFLPCLEPKSSLVHKDLIIYFMCLFISCSNRLKVPGSSRLKTSSQLIRSNQWHILCQRGGCHHFNLQNFTSIIKVGSELCLSGLCGIPG